MAKKTIDETLSSLENRASTTEIAFFGGSFTGIEKGLMISLLELAQAYVDSGKASGIRMSTRPDYINGEIISILKNYRVNAVELGIQSMSDKVLSASKRGHTAEKSREAMTFLKTSGFNTVGQMMIGLPSSSLEDEIHTAEEICSLGASASRIYPTIVFRDTELYEMTIRGEYTPLSVGEAVLRSAEVLEIFEKNRVDCIRIGLCDSENLHSDKAYAAGPNHPALGELIKGELFFKAFRETLISCGVKNTDQITFFVPKGALSAAVGHKKRNKSRLESEFSIKNIKFTENGELERYQIKLI